MRLLAFFASALLLPCIAVPQQPWTLDAAGWTMWSAPPQPPPLQPQAIYVSSSSGHDTNYLGFEPQPTIGTNRGPKKTIAAGYAALAALTNPRWLLLMEGDTFSDPQDLIGDWQLSGTSTAPMVFGTYGTGARPKISVNLANQHSAFFANNNQAGVKYLLVTGIQFECAGPASHDNQLRGIYFIGGGPEVDNPRENQWVRFEDCYVNGWFQGIAIDPFPINSCSNFSIRRCVVVDNYRVAPVELPGAGYVVNTGGLYAEEVNGLLVEECVFDRNGWDGANYDYSTRHAQNHNIYIQDNCTDVTVKGNISARGSGDNFQLRPIGTIHKNLSLKAPIHFSMGGDFAPNGASPPRTGDILGNVALEGDDIDPDRGLFLGWAYEIKNVEPPGTSTATMQYNIAANKDLTLGPNGGSPLGIYLNAGTNDGSKLGIRNLHVHNNVVFEWGAPLEVDTVSNPLPLGYNGMVGVVLHSNDIQEDWNGPQSTAYAFKGPDSHAVTGWSSHDNRFFTRKSNSTFMRWFDPSISGGRDYVVGVTGWPPTNGWRQAINTGGIVDDPASAEHAVMDPSHPALSRYLDPGRTIATYHQAGPPWGPAGTGGLPEFMDQCRLQRKGAWDDKFTGLRAVQYFQQGFRMTVP